jgi:hypothetical protein
MQLIVAPVFVYGPARTVVTFILIPPLSNKNQKPDSEISQKDIGTT